MKADQEGTSLSDPKEGPLTVSLERSGAEQAKACPIE